MLGKTTSRLNLDHSDAVVGRSPPGFVIPVDRFCAISRAEVSNRASAIRSKASGGIDPPQHRRFVTMAK
ncbi:MAG: hypothetical protein ACXWX3_11015, partial [Actinomycetota bacterium]